MLNRPTVEGGDKHYKQLNLQDITIETNYGASENSQQIEDEV